MKVQELLKKDTKLVTSREEDTVETTAQLLTSNNIGACPVRNGEGDLIGLISERDITRGFARRGGKVLELRVRDLMTRSVITCAPTDSVAEVAETMDRAHIRHLPVIDDGELVGMISQRDVLGAQLRQKELETNVLRETVIASGAAKTT